MTSRPVDRVLIVGGGIGGLAPAGALGRRGVEVHVVDEEPECGVGRIGIALRDLAAFERRIRGGLATPS